MRPGSITSQTSSSSETVRSTGTARAEAKSVSQDPTEEELLQQWRDAGYTSADLSQMLADAVDGRCAREERERQREPNIGYVCVDTSKWSDPKVTVTTTGFAESPEAQGSTAKVVSGLERLRDTINELLRLHAQFDEILDELELPPSRSSEEEPSAVGKMPTAYDFAHLFRDASYVTPSDFNRLVEQAQIVKDPNTGVESVETTLHPEAPKSYSAPQAKPPEDKSAFFDPRITQVAQYWFNSDGAGLVRNPRELYYHLCEGVPDFDELVGTYRATKWRTIEKNFLKWLDDPKTRRLFEAAKFQIVRYQSVPDPPKPGFEPKPPKLRGYSICAL